MAEEQKVIFKQGTQTQYDDTTKDGNALYFVGAGDSAEKLYHGEKLIGDTYNSTIGDEVKVKIDHTDLDDKPASVIKAMSVSEILDALLFPTIDAKISATPSLAFSNPKASKYERGINNTDISDTNIQASINGGKIINGDGTYHCPVVKDNNTINYTCNGTSVIEGSNPAKWIEPEYIYKASVTFEPGVNGINNPTNTKNNKGEISSVDVSKYVKLQEKSFTVKTYLPTYMGLWKDEYLTNPSKIWEDSKNMHDKLPTTNYANTPLVFDKLGENVRLFVAIPTESFNSDTKICEKSAALTPQDSTTIKLNIPTEYLTNPQNYTIVYTEGEVNANGPTSVCVAIKN